MKRWVLFALSLTLISTFAFAQAVVTPSGQATQGGIAVPVAPVVSPPLVTTPLMHLGNAPTTTVGTSTAAVTMQSGQAEPPSGVPIRPEIAVGPETVYLGPLSAATNTVNTANAPATGRQYVDLGVNSDAAITVTDGTNGRSLGEIARENRQHMQGASARTFTNADVERMAGAGGVSGIATNPNANNGYPGDNGVINSNGAVAAPTNPPATEQNATPPATEQNQKPSAAMPPPHEMSQAQTTANPADQNAQSSAATQNNEQRTLPKSASPLPLIGILGFAAAGAGLIVRKVRA